jgi:hypothetical protein
MVELTRQQLNKIGPTTDTLNNPIVVGSFVPI